MLNRAERIADRIAKALGWTLEQVGLTGFALIAIATWCIILAAIRDGLNRRR